MADDAQTYQTAVRVVEAVFRDLKYRSGFDWWWDEIDEEIKSEIRAELVGEVFSVLESE